MKHTNLLPMIVFVAFVGCQAGTQTKSRMDNSPNSSQITNTTDNSRKEMNTTISPQIAKTIQNIQNAASVSKDELNAFDPGKIHVVVNELYVQPNGIFPQPKNELKVVLKDGYGRFDVKIMNGNNGQGASMVDAKFSLNSNGLSFRGTVGSRNDMWIDMGGIHPNDVEQSAPTSYDLSYTAIGSTGTYNVSLHLVSKDKPEIIRKMTLVLE